jgi:hypothetical protein
MVVGGTISNIRLTIDDMVYVKYKKGTADM